MSNRASRRAFLRVAGSLAGALAARGASEPSTPTFTDVAAAAGLAHARNVSGSVENKQYLVEEMGCGVAIIDYDGDGWPDIFLVNGSTFDAARAAPKPTSYLFHNNRDGTFTDVTRKS